jgi:hypothetical protein
MLNGTPVELVRSTIRGHRPKQVGSLLVSYLIDGFRLWARLPHYQCKHAALFSVGDITEWILNRHCLAGLYNRALLDN